VVVNQRAERAHSLRAEVGCRASLSFCQCLRKSSNSPGRGAVLADDGVSPYTGASLMPGQLDRREAPMRADRITAFVAGLVLVSSQTLIDVCPVRLDARSRRNGTPTIGAPRRTRRSRCCCRSRRPRGRTTTPPPGPTTAIPANPCTKGGGAQNGDTPVRVFNGMPPDSSGRPRRQVRAREALRGCQLQHGSGSRRHAGTIAGDGGGPPGAAG